MNPFDQNYLNRKFDTGKNLSLEEVLVDSDDALTMEDEREEIWSMRIFAIVILMPFLVLGFRLYFLQSVKGAAYKIMAEGNKLRTTATIAPRGIIEDINGKIIASNMPNFELDVVPADLPQDANVLHEQVVKLSAVINRDPAEIGNLLLPLDKKSYRTESLINSIPKDQALILLARSSEFPGFRVANNPIRDYKDPLVFSHVIGYTGKITENELAEHEGQDYLYNDYIGKTGIEIEYENYLRGISGRKQSEIDASGTLKKNLADIPAIPGDNIKLNIDYDLQKVLYESLNAVLARSHLSRAAAVATNPKTGQVMALVSLPSYDNSLFARGISQSEYASLINNPNHPLLNRVIAGQYPPGSTVKPVMSIAGLTEGVITRDTKIVDDGVIRVGAFTFYGYDHSGLGVMDVYSAIARSSDIFFYVLGGGRAGTKFDGLGPNKIAEWWRKFNVGSTLGIDLPGEKPGLVPDEAWKEAVKKEKWYLGDTYHYAIGQGDLLTTPLQVNSWTATIANGGTIMQPYLLNQVIDHDGNVLRQIEPKVLAANQFDPEYIKVAQDGMRQTITAGTAQTLKSVGMAVAGKTGSAQFDPRNPSLTHAWFTSYAPFEDPQIALTVLVEASGEGGTYSVPVTKAVYDWWVANRLQR